MTKRTLIVVSLLIALRRPRVRPIRIGHRPSDGVHDFQLAVFEHGGMDGEEAAQTVLMRCDLDAEARPGLVARPAQRSVVADRQTRIRAKRSAAILRLGAEITEALKMTGIGCATRAAAIDQ